jgi:hypothetical protein
MRVLALSRDRIPRFNWLLDALLYKEQLYRPLGFRTGQARGHCPYTWNLWTARFLNFTYMELVPTRRANSTATGIGALKSLIKNVNYWFYG